MAQQAPEASTPSPNLMSVLSATNAPPSQAAQATKPNTAEFERILGLAQKGDAQAELAVGDAYYGARVVPRNLPEAYKWALASAKQGNARAESEIAWYYDFGVVVPRDGNQALTWRRKAAEDGDSDSQVEMGTRCETGRGVPMDLAAAVEWYQKAAIQNNANGKARYGYALLTGHGIDKDLEKGFSYLYSATDTSAYARFAVANCYATGLFVECDPTEAYRWCLLALEMDQEAAKLAAGLKSQLSTEQIAKAVKRAADFHRQTKTRDFQTDDLSIVFTDGPSVTIPFEFILRHIVIPVRLADQESDYLMLDTGSDVTLLDNETAARLKIKSNQYMPMQGGGADIVLSRLANDVNLSLPGLKISGATAGLLPNFDLDEYMGHPVVGILGYDILSHMVMTIDYVNKKITFRKPGTFKPDTTCEAIPLANKGVTPMLQAGIGAPADAIKGWFLIDSGDGGTVTLTKVFQQGNPKLTIEQAVKTGEAGLGGISYLLDGKCSQLRLGKLIVSNPIATFLLERQGGGSNLMGGFLGEGILDRFDVTFDSPDGVFFLKPNTKFADPFTHNEVGMGIKTVKGDYHAFVVYAVVPESAAAVGGFQAGDQIAGIDKVDTSTMTLSDLYEVLQKLGVHHLAILREGVPQELDIRIVENIK